MVNILSLKHTKNKANCVSLFYVYVWGEQLTLPSFNGDIETCLEGWFYLFQKGSQRSYLPPVSTQEEFRIILSEHIYLLIDKYVQH